MTLPCDSDTLDQIAVALEYPTEATALAASIASERLTKSCPEASEAFGILATWLEATSQFDAEETYTALFDLRPSCSLHVGYHVYGDAYQRGELLAGLVVEHVKAGVPLGSEIPDFLPTVLRLLGRLPHDEYLELFIDAILTVALAKMKLELRSIKKAPWARAVASLTELFGAPKHQAATEHAEDSLEDRIRREASHA